MFSTKNWIYLGLILSALAVFVHAAQLKPFRVRLTTASGTIVQLNRQGRARLLHQQSQFPVCNEGYKLGV